MYLRSMININYSHQIKNKALEMHLCVLNTLIKEIIHH